MTKDEHLAEFFGSLLVELAEVRAHRDAIQETCNDLLKQNLELKKQIEELQK